MRPSTLEQRRRLYLLARVTITRHYRRPLTLERVARGLASSPRQLNRAYAQFGQTTFREDLHGRRMRAAAQLLIEQPSIPICDVARLVGFRQPSHFAKAFRRRYGLTPAAFRREARDYACAARSDGAASDSTASAPGSDRHITVPPSGAASAYTEPPCCSATWRTIASPSPEPGRPRASAPR